MFTFDSTYTKVLQNMSNNKQAYAKSGTYSVELGELTDKVMDWQDEQRKKGNPITSKNRAIRELVILGLKKEGILK